MQQNNLVYMKLQFGAALQLKALGKKATKVEKMKNKKAGGRIWKDIEELSALVRSGEKTWEELDLDDMDVRTKWAGLFHRKKRAAGTFMMRLKVSPSLNLLPSLKGLSAA